MRLPTNREYATLFWILAIFCVALTRPQVRISLASLVKITLNPKIITLIALFYGYISICVYVGHLVGVWNLSLIKDTLIWSVAVGFPILLNFTNISKGRRFLRTTIVSTIEVSAFVGAFINIVDFHIVIEIILQPILLFLSMMHIADKDRKDAKPSRMFLNLLLPVIGTCLLVATTIHIWSNRETLDMTRIALSFVLSVWLAAASMSFVFVLAVIAAYEQLFIRMKFTNGKRSISTRTRLRIIAALRWHLREIDGLSGTWVKEILAASDTRGVWNAIRKYRVHQASIARECT